MIEAILVLVLAAIFQIAILVSIRAICESIGRQARCAEEALALLRELKHGGTTDARKEPESTIADSKPSRCEFT